MIVAFIVIACLSPFEDDIKFSKIVVDTRYVSEGVSVADVDNDGKLDIMAWNVWYEAPDWTPHEIAPYVEIDREKAWANSFNNWSSDINKDGWVDQIVIGHPGSKAYWRENPGDGKDPWKEHLIWRSACNESPLFADLFGDGEKVLVMGYDNKMAWFEPAEDPYAEWICHDVSAPDGAGSQRYSHGLGVGDITRNGSNEIITKDGYYIAQSKREELWNFVPANFGEDCAHMFAFNGGVLSTSAHARGVWWHQQLLGDGVRTHTIDDTVSVTHSANLVMLGESLNLITGKRKWGHPPGVDVGSEEPHWLMRYEFKDGKWVRYVIDEDSGVGTQFEVRDVDGDSLLDIVTSNKNGVFLFVQVRAPVVVRADAS